MPCVDWGKATPLQQRSHYEFLRRSPLLQNTPVQESSSRWQASTGWRPTRSLRCLFNLVSSKTSVVSHQSSESTHPLRP
eukprot:7380512-Prymnesium_polylepis.3